MPPLARCGALLLLLLLPLACGQEPKPTQPTKRTQPPKPAPPPKPLTASEREVLDALNKLLSSKFDGSVSKAFGKVSRWATPHTQASARLAGLTGGGVGAAAYDRDGSRALDNGEVGSAVKDAGVCCPTLSQRLATPLTGRVGRADRELCHAMEVHRRPRCGGGRRGVPPIPTTPGRCMVWGVKLTGAVVAEERSRGRRHFRRWAGSPVHLCSTSTARARYPHHPSYRAARHARDGLTLRISPCDSARPSHTAGAQVQLQELQAMIDIGNAQRRVPPAHLTRACTHFHDLNTGGGFGFASVSQQNAADQAA